MSPPATARAQSETVGIILLLGVFVVSASAVGVVYLGDVASGGDEVVVSADLSADGTDLRVDHLGGDALPNDELTVVVRADGNATRYPFAPPTGQFGPGDRRTFSDTLVANASNEVRLYHDGSGGEIERATLTPEPDPAAELGAIEGVVVGPGASSMRVASGASLGLRQVATPVTGATVAVEGAGRVAETTTGPGGVYRIEGLEPGEYEVSAVAPGLSVASATAEVKSNETATVDFRLDSLEPAEFEVEIAGVDATVDAGEALSVDATVENVGDERGTETVELRVGDETTDSVEVALDPGESRTVSLRWQTLPTDVGQETLTVDAGDDTATTTVEVLDAATDAVAYVDRDGDGDPDRRYTAVGLALLDAVDGHLVVYDDVGVDLSIGVAADRVTVRDGVAVDANEVELEADGDLRVGDGAAIDANGIALEADGDLRVGDGAAIDANGIALEADGDLRVGDGAAIDASETGLFVRTGDVSLRAGGDLIARDATVTAAATGFFLGSAGDVDLTAGGDADLRNGRFDATAQGLLGAGNGRISVTAGGRLRTDGASFDPSLA